MEMEMFCLLMAGKMQLSDRTLKHDSVKSDGCKTNSLLCNKPLCNVFIGAITFMKAAVCMQRDTILPYCPC